jgi:DNA-3-methyladenine glycosylase
MECIFVLVVTEKINTPAAVLIRGIIIDDNILDGPGKICKFLNITKEQNAIDLTKDKNFYFFDTFNIFEIKQTPRIGIKQGKDKLWRFVANIK